MRLFAGLRLPCAVEDRLSALRLRLGAPMDDLRWTNPEQWYITLHFFGEIDAQELSRVIESMRNFQHAEPLLTMESLGLFPAKGILYAGIEPTTEFTSFQAAFRDHVVPSARSASSLPFHPHITLARSKGKIGLKTLGRLGKPALPAFGIPLRWSAGPIELYESVLGVQGATYSTVATQGRVAQD